MVDKVYQRRYSNWRNDYLKGLEAIFNAHHDEILGIMTDEECATFNKIIENKPKKPRVRL
jgi:hypothetical protein